MQFCTLFNLSLTVKCGCLWLPAEIVPRKPIQNPDVCRKRFCTLATLSLWNHSGEVLRGEMGGHSEKSGSANWYRLTVLCYSMPQDMSAWGGPCLLTDNSWNPTPG